jgi:16S rRNA (guanine527-N7)-methyltransferase
MTAEEIATVALRAGLTLPPGAAEGFSVYLELLMRWNAKLNLTAVREPGQIIQRHFLECIFAAGQIPSHTKTLLDFGSGAGFPGIPIALCRPEISVTLAESQGKKAAFLREAVRTLALKAEVFAGRVETMIAERVFDAVALRAVDKMETACGAAFERVASGGSMVVFATRGTEEAVRNILPGMDWREAPAMPGLEKGILLSGIRRQI